MRMPWGKHKGLLLSEIPHSYLLWVLDKCDHATPTLKQQIRLELGIKAVPPTAAASTTSTPHSSPDRLDRAKTQMKAIYRELAMKYHPDKGGSRDTMSAINEMWSRFSSLMD